jgi:hypothetical protein
MSDLDLTLGDFFGPREGEPSQDRINEQALRKHLPSLEREISKRDKDAKWQAIYGGIAGNINELLDVKISDILVNSWNKCFEIVQYINKSRKLPNETFFVSLAEHKVRSEHNPSLKVLMNEEVIREINFNIAIVLIIKAMILEIKGGKIKKIHVTGSCKGQGAVKCEGFLVLERETRSIFLPGIIDLEGQLSYGPTPGIEASKFTIPPRPTKMKESSVDISAPIEAEPTYVDISAPIEAKPKYIESEAMPICTQCQSQLNPGANFCSICGAPAKQSAPPPKTCPQCGRPIKAGANFCGGCGLRLQS